MPKRKSDIHDNNGSHAVHPHSDRLESVLIHSKKVIFRALKVSRGFERQKLGRRQKQAKERGGEGEFARFEAEVVALKSLDLQITAEIHLFKTLLKIKSITTASEFPAYISAKVDASKSSQDAASANVRARLYNSAPVKSAMAEIISTVQGVIGVNRSTTSRPDKAQPVVSEAKSHPREEAQESNGAESSDAISKEHMLVAWNGLGESEHTPSEQNGFGSEEDLGLYASRLADSDSDSDSFNSAAEHPIPLTARDSSYSPITSPPPRKPSPQPSQSSQEPPFSPPPEHSYRPKRTTAAQSTTFLPSLTLSGYYSGSSAHSSDVDAEADAIAPPARKNRMGQQARRQLWEKKFGFRAKHIENPRHHEPQSQDRDRGWDARRGAQGSDERGKRGQGRGGRGGGAVYGQGYGGRGRGSHSGGNRGVSNVVGSGANTEAVSEKRDRGGGDGKGTGENGGGEGRLHPSWEAAKRKKAMEGEKKVVFEGKKTVF